MEPVTPLPIEAVLPALRDALAAGSAAVLQAPPGAGKTTLVPPALLEEDWVQGRRILVLEPRRLATRAAARRMAALRGEEVGETIGYRMRLDTRVGPRTRIEVVTEGVLARLIQSDPELKGIGAVLFDEFHERSLDADLGLALALDAQRALRPDLRLLVMSATLDGARIAALLGDATVVTSLGRVFPVETRWTEPAQGTAIEASVVSVVRRALGESEGDLLVFLPGGREIRRTARLLEEGGLPAGVFVAPLYGDLPQAAQDEAIRPAPAGRRKIVLATAIAETSLTIEGVRVVVDSGLARGPRFEPRTGMTRLATMRVSQASAEQRRGRAGRLAPGTCYRLWSEAEQRSLLPFATPEILEADLAPLALDLAEWGIADPAALAWLDQPPAAAYAQARALLRGLGALDASGRITPHGAAMARFASHPRLAHMMLEGKRLGHGALACDIAALLVGRDVLRTGPTRRDADLRTRLELLRRESADPAADRFALRQAAEQARLWRRQLGAKADEAGLAGTGLLLALAYPDRIARRRAGGAGQYLLANGSGAELVATDPLAAAEFLAIAEFDGDRQRARIFLAAALGRGEIEAEFAGQIENHEFIAWDARAEAVAAKRQRRLGALVLGEEKLADAPKAAVAAAVLDGIRGLGLAALPWDKALLNWRARVALLRRIEPDSWPDLSDAALTTSLDAWLLPYLDGITRRAQFQRIDLGAALRAPLSWDALQRLDRLAPTHMTVPSGSRLPIDYAEGEAPVLAVRLQELFGSEATPTIAEGRVPLVLHLLSPAGRPLQVTRDLAGFWQSSYRAVRAEMRGRYPKHPWPEDPLTAPPTRRAKRRNG
jgi:ATP-dependent helicase HrpB